MEFASGAAARKKAVVEKTSLCCTKDTTTACTALGRTYRSKVCDRKQRRWSRTRKGTWNSWRAVWWKNDADGGSQRSGTNGRARRTHFALPGGRGTSPTIHDNDEDEVGGSNRRPAKKVPERYLSKMRRRSFADRLMPLQLGSGCVFSRVYSEPLARALLRALVGCDCDFFG